MTTLVKSQRIAKNLPPLENPAEAEPAGVPGSLYDGAVSFGVSVVFHAALLLILAIFVYQPAEEEKLVSALEVRMEPLPEPEAITVTDISVEERLNAVNDTDSSQTLNSVRQLANASAPPPLAVAMLSTRSLLPGVLTGDANGFGGDGLAGLGESAGEGTVAGNGNEVKGDGEVGFFGTKAKGKSFVFIVDCSGSMNTPTGVFEPRTQILVTRFLRARQELYLSLGQLARDQTFYIIFYNHQTFPMYFPQSIQGLAPATTDHLGLARNWIQNVVPGGGTDPRIAFQLALALKPDVIFFLTDGAIPPVSRLVAKKSNVSRTRIHTIAFGIQEHQDILQGIAQDNQGRFRYVP